MRTLNAYCGWGRAFDSRASFAHAAAAPDVWWCQPLTWFCPSCSIQLGDGTVQRAVPLLHRLETGSPDRMEVRHACGGAFRYGR